MKRIILLSMVGLLLSCVGESSNTLTPLPKPGPQGPGTTSAADAIATIDLVVSPSTVLFGQDVTVKATPRTSSGQLVPDGTIISFTVGNTAVGTISPLATTVDGTSTALFTAGKTTPGSATITASSGTVTQSARISVLRPDAGSIEFVSASPKVIGIRGSGQAETALITFAVKDGQGRPVVDGTSVEFTLSGPNGGEYIGTTTGSNTAKSATKGGLATVILSSGSVAGPVSFTATVTVGQKTFLTSAPPVSISGGVPSATHFGLATTRFNLPGLVRFNSQTDILAFVADRFGNFNVLEGTTMSFYTEAGAISEPQTTDAQGSAKATLRTQNPRPASNGSPQDGFVRVLAVTVGEEAFHDVNGNGKFDVNEPFTNLPEPFLDSNDNTQHDDDEFFIDENRNGVHDEGLPVWDGPGCTQSGCKSTKMIWATINLVFTGHPRCSISHNASILPNTNPPEFTIPHGATRIFTFSVGDINTNFPPEGTTIEIASTGGTISGLASFTIKNVSPEARLEAGPFVKSISLTDDTSGTPVAFPGDPVTVTLTVTPPSELTPCLVSLKGFIQ